MFFTAYILYILRLLNLRKPHRQIKNNNNNNKIKILTYPGLA